MAADVVVPNIPPEVNRIEAIFDQLADLRPGMVLRLTGGMAEEDDLYVKTYTSQRKMAQKVHFFVILDINPEPESKSITVALTRTFDRLQQLEGIVPENKRRCWIPVSPAPLEEGMAHGPLTAFVVDQNQQATVVDDRAVWVYTRKAFVYKLGNPLPSPQSIRGPTRRFYSETAVAAIKEAIVDQGEKYEIVTA